MDKERAIYLLHQYHAGTCTPEERAEFVLLLHHPAFEALRQEMMDSQWPKEGEPDGQQMTPAGYDTVLATIKAIPRTTPVHPFRKWLPYAAAVILLTLAGIWLFFGNQTDNQPSIQAQVEDIQPGGNRATLTLADGRKMDLSDGQSGIVMENGIAYADGTAVIGNEASAPEEERASADTYYEIATPKGGTYQITLQDGTRVWLNAGSVLRYPSRFDEAQRVVELSGEAYFDVAQIRSKQAKDEKIPFRVHTKDQTVEVLGTQFNLRAYEDDADVRTTLVEGRVRVASPINKHAAIVLQPGQQSSYAGGKIAVTDVDVNPFIAWKDGYFDFLYTPFPEVMAQIARWYDIDLVYKGAMPTETFSGKMSRKLMLQNLLKFFEGSEIKLELVNGQLIIEE